MAPFALDWSLMPWPRVLAYLFLSTVVLGNLATYLRTRRGWRDGYSRKLNHFGHMAISTPLLAFLPAEQLLPALVLSTIAVVIIYAASSMSRLALVNGIVAGSLRDRDAPRARFFFFMPLISGNIALVTAAALFPLDAVRVAFFTVAFADGFAEPVGLRFGRNNQYTVRDFIWGGRNTKSIAGSTAVLGWAWIIAFLMLVYQGHGVSMSIAAALAFSVVTVCVEAGSPRGMDNMLLLCLCPPAFMAFSGLLT
ncbi:hypothetical protein [Stenotrophomonas sp.]|uniref:hypothetical protein n=1 Tax=Stenotrophomonas sp. TaxID=69392 RepID=UPI0028AB5860|nr:hypothetical protein [Stenotrophomonas sp.]